MEPTSHGGVTTLYGECTTPAEHAHNAAAMAGWVARARRKAGTFPTQKASPHWLLAKDGDWNGQVLYQHHYSNRRRGRLSGLFVGPGEKLVLLGEDGLAALAWRKFIDDTGQAGVCCAFFANYSPIRSSELIQEACEVAWRRWPGARLYTYVDDKQVRSAVPGACFRAAKWRSCGRTKGGLLVLERRPRPLQSAA